MSDAYDHITATDTNTLDGTREATVVVVTLGLVEREPGGDAARAHRPCRGCENAMQKNQIDRNNKQLHKLYKFKKLFLLRLALSSAFFCAR